MKKDEMNKVYSLAAEFIRELTPLPTDDYPRIKLMLLANAPTRNVKAFLQVVFDTTERQKPLLLEKQEVPPCKTFL